MRCVPNLNELSVPNEGVEATPSGVRCAPHFQARLRPGVGDTRKGLGYFVVAGINGNGGRRMELDVSGCKTLDFARGCISMQNQLVTFRQPA